MKTLLVQHSPRLSRANLDILLAKIDAIKDADVIVFPELSLSGYLLQDKLFEDAWEIDELAPIALKSEKCDIVIGAALWDNGKVYNSALYFSGGKLLHVHFKNHLPTYGMFEEGRYFSAGKEMLSFETKHGRAVMVVCEDLWRAETMDILSKADADVIYVLAASPARNFGEDGLLIETQWDALLKSAALFSQAHVLFVNRVGYEDGLGFWGGSRLITPMGECSHKLPLLSETEEMVLLHPRLRKIGRYLAKHS